MAKRLSSYSSGNEESGLEPSWFTRRTQSIPLLPFERQLIQELGCTQEEYEQFTRQVRHLARQRPAEYAHIPDIQNVEWVALGLTILATGFQVASYLLAPKPREEPPSSRQRAEGRQIVSDNVVGRSRFSPTTGFDSLQELAAYGNVIPVISTKRITASAEDIATGGETGTGGLLMSPQLVWSRVISLGNYQIIEQQFILGQGVIDAPFSSTATAKGLFLGNNFLDVSNTDDYAIYYRDGSSLDNRIGREHLIAGRLTENEPFPFSAPTSAGEITGVSDRDGLTFREPLAFCSTFTPSNNVDFGVYSAIPNGTSIRLQWKVISIALDRETIDYSPFNERKWISGVETRGIGADRNVVNFMVGDGMTGTGMNYARRCGVWDVGLTGITEVSSMSTDKYKIYDANVGAQIIITIGTPDRQSLSFEPVFEGEDTTNNGEEIRSNLESEHARSDDILQMGESVVIGTGIWKVIKRSIAGSLDTSDVAWEPDKQLLVTLECTKSLSAYGMASGGLFAKTRFGVPNRAALTANPAIGRCITGDDDFDFLNGNIPGDSGPREDYVLKETFFPICKVELASFENTMPCDVTEIGIKSQVWTRFNSLTNFTKVPEPSALTSNDRKNNTYTTGAVTSYEQRVSLFSLDIRKAGSTSEDQWTPVGETFAVIGRTPRDQFNYIRIYHPQKIALEYRLRPRNSAEFTYLATDPKFSVIVLDASKQSIESWTAPAVAPGLTAPVKILVSGQRRLLSDIAGIQRLSNEYTLTTYRTTKKAKSLLFTGTRYRPGTSSVTGTSPSPGEVSEGLRFLLAYRRFYGADLNISPPMDINSTAPSPAGPGFLSGRDSWEKANPALYSDGYIINVTEKYRPGTSKELTITFKLRRSVITGSYTETKYGVRRETLPCWTLLGDTVIESSADDFSIGESIYKGLILGYVGSSSSFKSPVLELIYSVSDLETEEIVTSRRTVERRFESFTAIAETTHYPDQISKSCDDGPEHSVVYVNESVAEYATDVVDAAGRFSRCAMIGLKLKSSRRVSQLDQFRIYLNNGIKLTNLLNIASPPAPSNLFTDLAYYLLTNKETGAGDFVEGLVDIDQMILTSKFLQRNGLFYSGALTEQVNLRTFLGDIAPTMLCNLVIRNGRFSIEPSLPIDNDGNIITGSVPFSAMFTSGNILDNTFTVEYLPAEERVDFTAVVRYREEIANQLPQSRSVIIRYTPDVLESTKEPSVEEFELQHVTSKAHAILVGKYYLSLRKRITHTISFKTSPLGISLTPGAFIRVVTESNPYSPANNGIITLRREVISARPLITSGEASYEVYAWTSDSDEVLETTLKVKVDEYGAVIATDGPAGAIFAIKESITRNNCYVVEAVEFEEDGIVNVVASHFPVDNDGKSVIANEILGLTSPDPFLVEEL